MEVELGEQQSDGFVLRPAGQPGFDDPIDGEIVEVDSQQRIVVRWSSAQLHTLVTITLQSITDGCRLTVVQRGFLGPQGTLRRRLLQRTYREMMDVRLPAALDDLAAEERARAKQLRSKSGAASTQRRRNVRHNEARFFSSVPRQASAAWAGLLAAGRNMARGRPSEPGATSPRQPPVRGIAPPAGEALRESPTTRLARGRWVRRHDPNARRGDGGRLDTDQARSRLAVAASVMILLLLAAMAVLVDRITSPAGPGVAAVAGERDPRGVLVSGGPPVSAAASGAAVGPSPLPPESATARPSSVTLVAVYRTERHVVGGYEGVITINNLSNRTMNGWSVRIVLPPLGLVVRAVQGAEVVQSDKEIRFAPTPVTMTVPAGEPVRFTFQVQGVGAPVECTINDQPCSGIPE